MIKYTEKDKIIKSHTSRTKEPLDANHIDMMGSHDVLKMWLNIDELLVGARMLEHIWPV